MDFSKTNQIFQREFINIEIGIAFKNQNIVIMKQGNGRGMVIMDKLKYQEQFLMIPENENFKTLDHDLTKSKKKRYSKFQGK